MTLFISRLKTNYFRNLIGLDIIPSPHFNLIDGVNGSGKTSILESIYFLGLGRSFRSHLASRIIHYDATTFDIFAQVQLGEGLDLKVGVEKSETGRLKIKVGSDNQSSIANLAKTIPLLLISPESYRLLDSGRRIRCQYIDWGVFHVEQLFFEKWQRFQRALKQRNSAIKNQASLELIQAWDEELVEAGLFMTNFRQDYVKQLFPVVETVLQQLIDLPGLSIEFSQGWDEELGLKEVLLQSMRKDLALGYTYYGPQRADLKIKVNDIPVEDVLSRGELKLLACALLLAQGILLKQTTQSNCIYLLDDIAAELDAHRRERIVQVLMDIQAQVFLTGVESNSFIGLKDIPETKMFHVEHGKVVGG